MALPDIDTVLGWRGRTIVDEAGEKIGTFDEIYLDAQTDQPEWAAVKKAGILSRGHVLVPLSEAQERDEKTLQVPFAKAHIEDAPEVDADGELSQQEEAQLYAHYGIPYSQEASETGLPRGEEQREDAPGRERGQQAAGAADPRETQQGAPAIPADESEQVPAGRQQRAAEGARGDEGTRAGDATPGRETGGGPTPAEQEVESFDVEPQPRERVRLKKYLVTEEVTKTVPVQREEIRVEREPVDRGDDR